jgi:VanZ family protein
MKWLRRVVLGCTIAYWIGLFTLTHLPALPPAIVPANDKTAHFVGYLVLAGLLFASMRLSGRRDAAVIVLTIGLAYGAIDEWLQIPVGRSCEMADWYADAAGVAVATVLSSGAARLLR